MPPLLASTLSNASRSQPFLLLQSTTQSCLPIIRHLISQVNNDTQGSTILFCFLYPPSDLVDQSHLNSANTQVFDWTGNVPDYDDGYFDPRSKILQIIHSAPSGSLTVVLDSVDTLLYDLGSSAETQRFLAELFSSIRARSSPSRLVLHDLAPSPLIPVLTQTRFSPTLFHATAHCSVLLTHLATAYLTPPPPLSSAEKFWGVFLPISERHYESEKLIWGPGGDGCGDRDFVVELLVRGADSSGRRRGVERVLEGWSVMEGPCELSSVESLRGLWTQNKVEESDADPTQNLSFNLNLTPEQQQSRAQVPLPYVRKGTAAEQAGDKPLQSVILYDPDSADDIDDDDPDEDLNI
ncbi:hypothetical protein AcW1_000567 [Taiwanofungus camphoratus]|nr:hypothetical protein AcW1_000567 [Antrodia cinnamomea]